MSEKFAGYILLVAGLIIMGISTLSIYKVFTKQASPVKLFDNKSITLDLGKMLPSQELFSSQAINDMSNITAHYFLMSFVLGVGFKVSTLAIQLLRPIEIKLQTGAK